MLRAKKCSSLYAGFLLNGLPISRRWVDGNKKQIIHALKHKVGRPNLISKKKLEPYCFLISNNLWMCSVFSHSSRRTLFRDSYYGASKHIGFTLQSRCVCANSAVIWRVGRLKRESFSHQHFLKHLYLQILHVCRKESIISVSAGETHLYLWKVTTPSMSSSSNKTAVLKNKQLLFNSVVINKYNLCQHDP